MPKSGKKTSEYDAGLGLYAADSWWDLGKLLAGREKVDVLTRRVASMKEQLPPWQRDAVTLARLQEFLDTADRLLKEHHIGKDIARSAESLMNPKNYRITAKKVGEFLQITESGELFWALEYESLFNALEPPQTDEMPFSEVMAKCADSKCPQLFLKSRSDQKYHTDKCRMRVANRTAYKKASSERVARGRRRRR